MRDFTTKAMAAMALIAAASPAALADWGTADAPKVLIEDTGYSSAQTARTSTGETFVVWTEGRANIGFMLRGQLLDANGNKMWGEDGIIIDDNNTPTWYSYWNIVVTPDDQLVVSWADSRGEEAPEEDMGYQTQVPVLYKIDREGKMVWGEDGMTLDPTKYKFPPKLFLVGENLYAKCYPEAQLGAIQMMLIDEFGEPAWTDGKNFSGQIIASEGDEFIGVYSNENGVVAMRYNKDMRQRWKKAVVISEHQYGGHELNPYKLASDGNGGVIVCYPAVLGDFASMPVVGYVTATGETVFGEYVATTTSGNHAYPVLGVNTEAEDMLVLWQADLAGGRRNLQAQRLDYFGERLWGEEFGLDLESKIEAAGWGYGPIAVESLGENEWLLAYADEHKYGENQLFLARCDNEGKIIDKTLVGTPCNLNSPRVALEGEDVYITWSEDHKFVNDEGQDDGHTTLMGVKMSAHFTGVESIDAEAGQAVATEYYTIDGIRLTAPQKGLNIVRKSDGSVEKVIF